jgi:hypothetical protein
LESLGILRQIASRAIINHGSSDVANIIIEGLLGASDRALDQGDDLYEVARCAAKVRARTLVVDG